MEEMKNERHSLPVVSLHRLSGEISYQHIHVQRHIMTLHAWRLMTKLKVPFGVPIWDTKGCDKYLTPLE